MPAAARLLGNAPSAWPVHSLTLGSQSYTQAELLTILLTPLGRGASADASVNLAHELITAKLDIAKDSDPTPVSAIVADADKLLGGFPGKLPYHVKSSTSTGKSMTKDAGVLSNYEKARLTRNCTR